MTAALRSRLPFVPLLIALAATLAAPLAHAQWSVTDDETHTILKDGFKRFDVKPTTSPTNADSTLFSRTRPTAPPSKWTPANPDPQNWSTDGLKDIEKPCIGMADNQQSICTEIANTRSAYYNYMKNMYDANIKRYDLLQKLTDARQKILSNEFGHLQENTNEILALQTLITLDRQQMESVDHGYRMRIDFLTQQMTQKAKDAAAGKTGSNPVNNLFSSLTSTLIGGAVLELALIGQSSGTAAQKLSIDGGNPSNPGW